MSSRYSTVAEIRDNEGDVIGQFPLRVVITHPQHGLRSWDATCTTTDGSLAPHADGGTLILKMEDGTEVKAHLAEASGHYRRGLGFRWHYRFIRALGG